MAKKGFKRKLTVILSAAVKGYSRLIGEDEGSALRTFRNYLTSISFKLLKFNGGGHRNTMPQPPVCESPRLRNYFDVPFRGWPN